MVKTRHEWREPGSRGLRPGELLAIVAFWAFLAVFTAAGRMLDPRVPSDTTFARGLVTLAFIEYTMWAALTVPVFYIGARMGATDRGTMSRMPTFLTLGLIVAVAVDATLRIFRAELLGPPRFPSSTLSHVIQLEFLDDFLIYVAILAAALARDYFARYQARLDETRELRTQLAEARLTVLRGQLNPHFLFNTLNAVASLLEADPRGARRMISRLGDLLRHTLEEADESEIPLERELELLRRYLDIMQIRFQGSLEARVDVDASLRDALVPNMILQPIVENAFEHGLAGMETGARIEVRVRRSGEDLVLTVRDNGAGPGDSEPGIGIPNTMSRLAALYGTAQKFELRKAHDGPGAVAEITLPYHELPIGQAPQDG
jgi:sensor histidine kinase YesM